MRQLPSGTVTFLFTDVEGSTRLLQELGPERFAAALAEHRRVLRRAFEAHGGVEVDTQGDAFFVAFPTAPGAVAAARAAADGLAGGPIQVRTGIHSGTPFLTDEGYVGIDVHRAARIAACGHGGQVILSAASAGLVDAEDLLDLGEHRLKDLSAPERVFQLGDAPYPPLRSLYRTNLPVPATPFLGRELELAGLAALLTADEPRLVTLTGPGGVGKTRLALQAAGAAADGFSDGVFWVPLASLAGPGLVLPALAQAVGAKGSPAEHISDQSLLLVLDNFEHVIDAAGEVAALLAACPSLHVIVTSRELLRLPGEQAYPVTELRPADGLALFLARARAAEPSFEASDQVAELCARLEQLPLALELAAARVRVLSPEQLLERLSDRLDLLRAGRGADARQQTLRATLEWSHELLAPDEQRLFARLAVFSGGWTLEAVEEVCESDLDVLQSLVDKSLVRPHRAGRFFMLETIRELAAERLESTGESAELRDRHATFFLALAEAEQPRLESGALEAFERVEVDLPNFRAAFARLCETDAAAALRLVSAFGEFWSARGYLGEGRGWFGAALDRYREADADRARALALASVLASLQADWPETRRLAEESRAMSRSLGDPLPAAEALLTLGRALLAEGDPEQALALFVEAEHLGLAAGQARVLGMARFNAGYLELERGHYDRARTHFEAACETFDAADNWYGGARSRAALGAVALHAGRCGDAVSPLRGSLELSRAMGDRDDLAWALQLLGVALSESRPELAARLLGAAEALRETLGGKLEGIELSLHERALGVLAPLEVKALETAWLAGRELTPDAAAELALRQTAGIGARPASVSRPEQRPAR